MTSTNAMSRSSPARAENVSSTNGKNHSGTSPKPSSHGTVGESSTAYFEGDSMSLITILSELRYEARKAYEILQQPVTDGDEKLDPTRLIGAGDRVHLANILLSACILVIFALLGGEYSYVAMFALVFNQLGLIYDNLICFLGKFVGSGVKLQVLTKGRFLMHGAVMPLLAMALTEIAHSHGLYSTPVYLGLKVILTGYMVYELMHWQAYPLEKFVAVDNRYSTKNNKTVLAGTLVYSSGKGIEMALPAIALVLYELVLGMVLSWTGGAASVMVGRALVASAVIVLGTCADPSRPDVQLMGENFLGASLWAILVFGYSPANAA